MKWLASKNAGYKKVKSSLYPDVTIYSKPDEIKYVGKFKQIKKSFITEKEAAIWADSERIKNNLEPRNILKKK